jgi:hypothetical protein
MHALARCWAPPGGRARGTLARPAAYAAVTSWRPRLGRHRQHGQSPRPPNPEPHAEPEPPGNSRPRGGALGQLALVIGAWLAYSLARSLSGDDIEAALQRGRDLQHWDSLLGFGWTIDLNVWVTSHVLVAVPMTFEYASLHYLVTPLVLVWLWRAHPATYRPALLSLLAMSAVGLAVYIALPVAPPRLLPGSDWIDTMHAWSHVGWWGGAASAPAGFEHLTDQYAAMPSLHVGWAVWCAWAWHRAARSSTVRRLAWIYPATVAVIVVATANHYVLDVAAGVAIALTSCALVPRGVARLRRDTSTSTEARRPEDVIQILRPITGFAEDSLINVIDLRDQGRVKRDQLEAEQLSESRRD